MISDWIAVVRAQEARRPEISELRRTGADQEAVDRRRG